AWKHHFKADPGNDVILQKMKLNLADESSVTKHVELVQKVKADVIIVDTLRRAMAAMVAENTNEASLAIRHVDIIRKAAGPEATLLALHHPAKQDRKSTRLNCSRVKSADDGYSSERKDTARVLCTGRS